MHAAFKGQGLLRTVVLVPWAVLTVVTAIMWRTIFESPLRLREHDPGHADTVWLGSEPQALIVIIIADVWKTAPFMALLILAGLQVIPARSTRRRRSTARRRGSGSRRITLPLLTPAILVALIFRTLDALRIFDLPYVLTKGAERHDDAVDDRPGDVRRRTGSTASGSAHGDPDVHHRDDRLVLVHPLRRRQHPRTGGGLAMEAGAATAPQAATRRACEDQDQQVARPAEDAVVDVDRRRRDRRLLPVPVLLAGQHLAEDGRRPVGRRACSRRTRRSTTTSRSSRTPTSRKALRNSAIVALITTVLGARSSGRSAPTRWRA